MPSKRQPVLHYGWETGERLVSGGITTIWFEEVAPIPEEVWKMIEWHNEAWKSIAWNEPNNQKKSIENKAMDKNANNSELLNCSELPINP